MATTASSSTPGWAKVQIPRPLQRLFDLFPLRAYEPNDLPERSRQLTASHLPTLYIFTTEEAARLGLPSFNPTCLRWQTLLRLTGLEFRVLPSTNHASPTGALPFILPPRQQLSSSQPPSPIPTSKLLPYARQHCNPAKNRHPATSGDKLFPTRARAYVALVSSHLRSAWLHALYLDPAHAELLDELYLRPASSSRAVRAALKAQLRKAAAEQILNSAPEAGGLHTEYNSSTDGHWTGGHEPVVINPRIVYSHAREALAALAALLAESATEWFFDADTPSEFDAAVFSYTHLMMEYMDQPGGLGEMVRRAGEGELARHREGLLRFVWPEMAGGKKEGK